ncbi:IS4 family transposase [Rubripirellula lacrimiformis]|uniref:IS4 family transposase n=1 Tax=Rubripirellula lacrimiformis TaxID=1930273 RepID=UPI0011A792CC|nr:IS4 family transposase [Rubripirellula lacrimiformis]
MFGRVPCGGAFGVRAGRCPSLSYTSFLRHSVPDISSRDGDDSMCPGWIEEETRTLDLGDKRRSKRFRRILEQFDQVAPSTPAACGEVADLTATYRLFNTPSVNWMAILQPHNQATMERSAKYDVVVLAQDTTVCDLTKPSRQVVGAGPLEDVKKRGFFLHPLYAVTLDGLVLGCVDQLIWTRDSIRQNVGKAQRDREIRTMAFEEKESARWLELMQSGEQIALANPQTHYIGVSDSESDIYELLIQNNDLAENYDFVIRGCQDRRVYLGSAEQPKVLSEAIAEVPFSHEFEVSVSPRKSLISGESRKRRSNRDGRTATISVRAKTVQVHGPQRPGGKVARVELQVVEAVELDPPVGCEPIHWVLFTSLAVTSLAQIELVLSAYCRRWDIEVFFKTLKSGMRIEKLKYQSIDAYLNAVAALMITAFRVEQLKSASRVTPEASCGAIYDATFWQAVMTVVEGGVLHSDTPPTLKDFCRVIAKLGGYVDQHGQGPPGSTTIWRGLLKAHAYHEAYLAIKGLK